MGNIINKHNEVKIVLMLAFSTDKVMIDEFMDALKKKEFKGHYIAERSVSVVASGGKLLYDRFDEKGNRVAHFRGVL